MPAVIDENQLRRAYDTYSGPLLRYIYRFTGNAEAAEEVLHDVFIEYLAGKFAGSDGAAFKAWLYTVARNKSLNRARSSARVPVAIEIAPERDAEQAFLARERAHRLAALESRMPEDLRQTWALRKRGLDYRSIAETLAVPIGTVKSRFHRLVEFLRKEMGNET